MGSPWPKLLIICWVTKKLEVDLIKALKVQVTRLNQSVVDSPVQVFRKIILAATRRMKQREERLRVGHAIQHFSKEAARQGRGLPKVREVQP